MWQWTAGSFTEQTHLILHVHFFTWRRSYHRLHCSHSFIAAALSLQPSFHSALSFNGQSDAEKTNTKGLDKKAMGKAPATNCQAMEARMVVMIAPRNPKLKNSCIPSETPKSTKLGRTMLSIQQLFHANTKISTISSQDGWLLFDELDHIRFDAKTRGPVPLLSDKVRKLAFYCQMSRIKCTFWCHAGSEFLLDS